MWGMPKFLCKLLVFDQDQIALLQYLKGERKKAVASNCLVLVQCVEDMFFFGLFGQILSSMSQSQPIRVEQFILRSLNVGESNSIFSFILARLIKNRVHNFKWRRLYASVCDGVAYRSDSFRPLADLIDLAKAWRTWKNLGDKQALIDLTIDGVPVGDLINDSFIRFKPAPTVALESRYLWLTIWQAYRDVRRAKAYFAAEKPKLYLTTYSAYVQHGIAVRVALLNRVRVFSFGEYQEFAKELSVRDWFHTVDPDPLSADFAKLDDKEAKLAIARAALSKRLQGGIDAATVYMKQSAYAESGEPIPDVRDAVIVFLHDFYDSPYIYRDMVFSDFWDWVCFTIETLEAAGIPFFLKPHPNQIQLNDDVLAALRKRYSTISIISTKVANTQLVRGGMAAAVTVYGSVANEMAYLGIPTVTCSRHAHSSFDFCKTARTKSEYAELLRGSRTRTMNPDTMRDQSLIFYYMFNFGKGEAERALTDVTMKFRLACASPLGQRQLSAMLREIAASPAYEEYLTKWSHIVGGAFPAMADAVRA